MRNIMKHKKNTTQKNKFRKTIKNSGGKRKTIKNSGGKRKTKKNGGEKRGREETGREDLQPRKRRQTIDVKELKGNTSSKDFIRRFIEQNIVDGPQIVSLPVPPERHAILVDIQKDKIMISDWGGESNRTRNKRIGTTKEQRERWRIYAEFMDILQDEIGLEIKYYPVDEELANNSSEHHANCGNRGGCSHYIYNWIEKHCPDNQCPVIPESSSSDSV